VNFAVLLSPLSDRLSQTLARAKLITNLFMMALNICSCTGTYIEEEEAEEKMRKSKKKSKRKLTITITMSTKPRLRKKQWVPRTKSCSRNLHKSI